MAAVAAIGEQEFDFVMSDLGLPGMTGTKSGSATAGFHLHLKKLAVMNNWTRRSNACSQSS
jgi:hypothetical protein